MHNVDIKYMIILFIITDNVTDILNNPIYFNNPSTRPWIKYTPKLVFERIINNFSLNFTKLFLANKNIEVEYIITLNVSYLKNTSVIPFVLELMIVPINVIKNPIIPRI